MVDRGPCRPACLSGEGVLLFLSAFSHTWLARQTHTHTRICGPFYVAHMGLSTKTSHLLFLLHTHAHTQMHRCTYPGQNCDQRGCEIVTTDYMSFFLKALVYGTLTSESKCCCTWLWFSSMGNFETKMKRYITADLYFKNKTFHLVSLVTSQYTSVWKQLIKLSFTVCIRMHLVSQVKVSLVLLMSTK